MLRRLAIVIVGLAAAAIVAASPAGAHAVLVRSAPPPGGTVAAGGITLYFDNAVMPDLSTMTATENGRAVGLGPLEHDRGKPTTLHAPAPPGLASGQFILTWTAVAADGHRTTGTAPMLLGATPVRATTQTASAMAPAVSVGDTSAVNTAMTLTRDVGYLVLAMLCGGLVFIAFVWPAGGAVRRARGVLWAAALIGVATSLVSIVLEASLLDRGVVDVITTPFGRVGTARALLFVLAVPLIVMLTRRGAAAATSTSWRVGAVAIATGIARTPGFADHASESRLPIVGSTADFVHVAAMAVWLGGLVMLAVAVLPRRQAAELSTVVPRFSSIAGAAVGFVVVAGAVMSWQLVGSAHALLATHFGRLLLVKLAVFGVLLGAAQASRRWVAQRLDFAVLLGGDAATLRPFVISVAAEAALALAVIAVAGALVVTRPAI